MGRPTIAELATSAKVSVSTINRLLHGTGSVRQDTIDRIMESAAQIGFYGLGAIKERKRAALPHYRLGFLLQQSHRQLYQMLGQAIVSATARRKDVVAQADVRFEDNLAPEVIAEHLLRLAETSDAVSLIAGDHPLIGQAIDALRSKGTPVVAYITDLSAAGRAGYVGTDNWKLGRTAAWFIAQTARQPGRVATFIGNHRYQCQDIADASFRSYIRESAPQFVVGDALPTQEEPGNAYQMVRAVIEQSPDLVGIFIGGGGVSGILRAIRELSADQRQHIRIVCRDMGQETRKGLGEGLITAALCHPMQRTSDELVDVMVSLVGQRRTASIVQRVVPFEIVTPESAWA